MKWLAWLAQDVREVTRRRNLAANDLLDLAPRESILRAVKRLLIVVLLGALVVGIADASALALTKWKAGEQEYSYVTAPPDEYGEEDCAKEDETDLNTSLSSACWWQSATITYRFLIPLRARLRGATVYYHGENTDGTAGDSCRDERIWATRYQRRVRVHFQHRGLGNYNWMCTIERVVIRFRFPS
jgi:hypothetical protein